jgi:hypothetical protein
MNLNERNLVFTLNCLRDGIFLECTFYRKLLKSKSVVIVKLNQDLLLFRWVWSLTLKHCIERHFNGTDAERYFYDTALGKIVLEQCQKVDNKSFPPKFLRRKELKQNYLCATVREMSTSRAYNRPRN